MLPWYDGAWGHLLLFVIDELLITLSAHRCETKSTMPSEAGLGLLLVIGILSFAVTASEGTASVVGGQRPRVRNLLQLDATKIDRYSHMHQSQVTT